MNAPQYFRRPPGWVTAVIVVAMLPALAFPTMLGLTPASPAGLVKLMVWGYPLYVLVTGWVAWYCYDQRPWLCWVLVGVMLLTHAAMWALVLTA